MDMATPINSNSNQAPSASPLATDMLARLQASAQGETASSGAFNAWMEKHALTADKLKASGDDKAAQPKPSEAPARDSSSTASRLLEQALNRTRQQAAAVARQAEQNAHAQAQAAGKAAPQPKAKVDGAAAKSEDDAAKPAAEDEEAGQTKVSASANPEANAIVQELTPPPEVKTDDAAAMMAWLAGLTHGDPTLGKKLGPKAGTAAGADASGQSKTAAAQVDPRGSDASGASGANPLAATAELGTRQALPALTAQLQGELPQSFKEELANQTAADPLGGLSGALAMRSSPGWQRADAAAMPHEQATLQAPVGSDTFAQALSDQLTMWVNKAADNGPMTAELHLNPAELGPIHVKISLDGSDAQVNFAAAAVETRQAIEASMPTLSTALQDVGLNLTGGDVSSQTSQQAFQQAFEQSGGASPGGTGARALGATPGEAAPAGRAVAAPRPGRAGGLDLYA
jgi:flagellar hook-length control protein FliK